MHRSESARLEAAAGLVAGGAVAVLSGAGLSTDSGIPDYRGPSGAMVRGRHTPMTHQQFVADPMARRRYWARSHVGWNVMAAAVPNAGHAAVAELERRGLVDGTITQNVDGLHSKAGTRRVVDLHGRLDRVLCLDCGATSRRADLADRFAAANHRWSGRATSLNPDGDVDLAEEELRSFVVVDCLVCGGTLMPDVVYFGGRVPDRRVARAMALVDDARVLLVLGTSLTVYSGRRFVVRTTKSRTPVVIINSGPTRCDGLATLKLDEPLGSVLPRLVERIDERRAGDRALARP